MLFTIKNKFKSDFEKNSFTSALISILITLLFFICIAYDLLPIVAGILIISFLCKTINIRKWEQIFSDERNNPKFD